MVSERPVKRVVVLLLLLAGVWQFGNGMWLQAKAQLAQYLISKAWQQTLVRQAPVKPWPWADTWPVARLQWGEDVELYVLAGVNGASLPFGPGMERHAGNLLIAGHRDTHFAFLDRLHRGHRILLMDMRGEQTVYQIQTSRIVDSRDTMLNSDNAGLLLVTCYPFDAVRAGGPLRFVVAATLVGQQTEDKKTTSIQI